MNRPLREFLQKYNKKTKINVSFSVLALLVLLLVSLTFPFRDRIFSTLFPKPPSLAAAGLNLTATFNSIGIEVPSEPAVSGAMRFKKTSDSTWRNGLDMWQAGGALYGSALLLEPGTSYDIEITPAGGAPLIGSIATKANITTAGLVNSTTKKSALTPTHYVTTNGSASPDGSQANPWTLAQAITAANAAITDMVIQVAPGYYKGGVGAINPPAGKKVTVVAEYPAVDDTRAEVNLANKSIIEPTATTLQGGTSWTPVNPDGDLTHTLYRWTAPITNIEQLGFAPTHEEKPKRLANWKQAVAMGGPSGFATLVYTNLTYNYGFWVDPNAANSVYARFPQDVNPNTYFIAASRSDGITVSGSDVRISGFDLREFHAGITVNSNSVNVILDHNLIANSEHGIYFYSTVPANYSRDHLVEYNKIYDSSLWGPSPTDPADPIISWNFIKFDVQLSNSGITASLFPSNKMGEKNETVGIMSRGGANNAVVRFNTIDGPFNGISVYNTGYDKNATKDFDIHDNVLQHISDDSFEPEFQGINWRIWNNRVENVSTVLSTGPLQYGPVYLFKNQLYRINKEGVGRERVPGIYPGGTASVGGSSVAATFFKYSKDSTPNARVYVINNTFWADSTFGVGVDGSGQYASGITQTESFYLRNNILRSTRYAFQAPTTANWNENYNHFVTSDASRGIILGLIKYTTNVAGYQLVASAPNTNVSGNFVTASVVDNALNNPTGGDISLKAGSPLVDIGTVVPNIADITGFNYQGRNPDLGACEGNDCSAKIGGAPIPTPTPTPTLIPTPTPVGGPVIPSLPPIVSTPSPSPAPQVSLTIATNPTISSITGNSAIITWTTSLPASSQVGYGITDTNSFQTTEVDIISKVTSHTVTLSNLRPCTSYEFKVISRIGATSVNSPDSNFDTTNCSGGSSIQSHTSKYVTIGSVSNILMDLLDVNSKGIKLNIPPTAFASNTYFQIKKLDKQKVFGALSTPSGFSAVGDYTYHLDALTNPSNALSSFNNTVKVTVNYKPEDVVGINETSLRIHRFNTNNDSWEALSNCSIDTSAKTISCDTTAFSEFSLFGTPSATNLPVKSDSSRIILAALMVVAILAVILSLLHPKVRKHLKRKKHHPEHK